MHRDVVQKGGAATVMCAYSSLNYSGFAPDCANPFLLQTVGFVTCLTRSHIPSRCARCCVSNGSSTVRLPAPLQSCSG